MFSAMIYSDEELNFDSPSPDIRYNLKRTKPSGNAAAGELPRECSDLHACQLESMLSLEQRSHSGLICSDLQPEFTPDHRFFLVQWLHSACYQCDLNLTAFSVAVALLDRLLGAIAIPLPLAQLVTIAIVSIAAKLDGPDMVDDLTRFQVRTDVWSTAYTSEQIGEMELQVLMSLDWRTHCATSADFIDRLLTLAYVGRDKFGVLCDEALATTVRAKARQFVFASLHESSMVAPKPSTVAAAAVLISLRDCATEKEQQQAFSRIRKHLDESELQTILDKYRNNSSAPGDCMPQPSEDTFEDILYQEAQEQILAKPKLPEHDENPELPSLPAIRVSADGGLCDRLYDSQGSDSPSSTAYIEAINSRPTTASISPTSEIAAEMINE